jgi:hypothetical protein
LDAADFILLRKKTMMIRHRVILLLLLLVNIINFIGVAVDGFVISGNNDGIVLSSFVSTKNTATTIIRPRTNNNNHVLPATITLIQSSPTRVRRMPTSSSSRSSSSSTRITSFVLLSSRNDEIAQLEEQLRQLKREQDMADMNMRVTSTANDDDTMATTTTMRSTTEDDKKRFNEVLKGKDMILSEQELIQGGIVSDPILDSSSNNNNMGLIVGAMAAVVLLGGLFSFSQIPIGSESLSQYSATGSSTTAFKQIDLGDLNPDNAEK